MTDRPSMIGTVGMALLASFLVPLAVLIAQDSDQLSPEGILAASLAMGGLILAVFAALRAVAYFGGLYQDMQERANEIRCITPRNRELELLASLQADRLQFIPPNIDHVELLLASQWTGKVWDVEEALATRDGAIPLLFVREFLQASGIVSLVPINHYSEGTSDYINARSLTGWLRQQGVAHDGDGSQAGRAARWVSPEARRATMELFDVTMDLDAEVERRR